MVDVHDPTVVGRRTTQAPGSSPTAVPIGPPARRPTAGTTPPGAQRDHGGDSVGVHVIGAAAVRCRPVQREKSWDVGDERRERVACFGGSDAAFASPPTNSRRGDTTSVHGSSQ